VSFERALWFHRASLSCCQHNACDMVGVVNRRGTLAPTLLPPTSLFIAYIDATARIVNVGDVLRWAGIAVCCGSLVAGYRHCFRYAAIMRYARLVAGGDDGVCRLGLSLRYAFCRHVGGGPSTCFFSRGSGDAKLSGRGDMARSCSGGAAADDRRGMPRRAACGEDTASAGLKTWYSTPATQFVGRFAWTWRRVAASAWATCLPRTPFYPDAMRIAALIAPPTATWMVLGRSAAYECLVACCAVRGVYK